MIPNRHLSQLLFLLSWLALFNAGCAVNPVTHEREFSLVSEAEEIRMGEQAYPIYTQQSEGLFPDSDLQAYVTRVGKRLAAASHRPNLAYEYNVVNDSAINAYALPGGKISITRGLLTRMGNEAQLASVLGHETGHVTARHSAAGMTRQKMAGVLVGLGAAALGAYDVQGSDLLLKGGLLATNLVLQKYSRDQERQADLLGMEYMTRVGYNPDGMVQTMEILQTSQSREPGAVEALFQSHPLTAERVATARRLAAAQPAALKTEAKLKAAPFRKATARLRQTAPAYTKMDEGRKALADDDPGRAAALLAEATDLAPGQALIWAFRAAAEAKAEHLDRASRSAEKAATLDPNLFRARFTAGVIAFEKDQHPASLAHLEAADRLVPDQPQVIFYRGRNKEAQGRREPAARDYAAVLQRVRKGPMAKYCMKRLAEWGYVKRK